MRSLSGKVAVVTGGGGTGIGHHLVRALVAQGATVAFCDIAGLESTSAAIAGHDHLAALVDITDRAAVDAFLDAVIDRFGGFDLLINNAGIALGDRTFEEVTAADLQRITDINYWGVVHTTQRAYAHLLGRPEAAIVNISSSQGILALPYLVPYCTTKFAVRGFTDALRAEHRIRGIDHVTVHTVHPGAVATDITLNADYQNSSSRRFHEDLQRGTPPAKAAQIILRGVTRNRGRIFISDGRAHDVLTRLAPSGYVRVVQALMRKRGITPR